MTQLIFGNGDTQLVDIVGPVANAATEADFSEAEAVWRGSTLQSRAYCLFFYFQRAGYLPHFMPMVFPGDDPEVPTFLRTLKLDDGGEAVAINSAWIQRVHDECVRTGMMRPSPANAERPDG